jgi:hypothetical protein
MIIFNATKLAAVAQAQSKEETRYYLRGVYFDGNIAVATDGNIATIAIDEDSTNDANGIYPVSKKAITAMKSKRANHVTFDNGILTVFAHSLNSDNTPDPLYLESSVKIDGTFPNWRNIVPQDRGSNTDAGFSPVIQRKLCDTAKIIGASAYRMFGDDTKDSAIRAHVVAYNDNNDVFSVVMPMRANFATNQPEWAIKPFDKAA